MTTKRTSANSMNQTGMVSIMVTLLMMLVISLIVLGFAQVSRREQRQSLDRQLSTQAFFAAETGVNDARQKIADKLAADGTIDDKNECGPTPEYGADPKINTANDVSYTCLLISSKLKNLHVTPLTAGDKSVVVPLQPDTGTIRNLHINWSALSTPSGSDIAKCEGNLKPNDNFPQNAGTAWECPYGVLRIDLVPTDDLSRAATTAGQKSIFLYPVKNGSASVAFAKSPADGNTAIVADMRCKPSDTSCEVDITGMAASGSNTYALRMTAIYKSGTVDISAQDGPGDIVFKNAQVQIDATGKAQDVLRRIQVRLPITSSTDVPDYALQSASSICKRFETNATTFTIKDTFTGGQDTRNPLCKPY